MGFERTLIFRAGWWEREGEVYNLHMKNKLKSEIFNNKKKFLNKKDFAMTMS